MINSSSYRIHHMHIRTSYETPGQLPVAPKYRWLLLQPQTKFMVHVLAWLFLYSTPALLLAFFNQRSFQLFFNPVNLVYLASFIILACFTYFNYLWLAPYFFTRKKAVLYFFSVSMFIVLFAGLQYLAILAVATPQTALAGTVYNILLFIISSFSGIILYVNNELRAAGNETRKIKTSLLNARIKPHFLFNSLNWIYMLSLEQSKETPNAILQLSGMMRYMLEEPDNHFTDLATELKYIKNYVALQKGRMGNTVSITSSIPVFTARGKVAPLLLMSFIENAFKHGINPDEDSAISIDISISHNRLHMHVINNKITPAPNTPSHRIGINNAQQRLQTLYPSMHELEIMENNKIYAVKLSIEIV